MGSRVNVHGFSEGHFIAVHQGDAWVEAPRQGDGTKGRQFPRKAKGRPDCSGTTH